MSDLPIDESAPSPEEAEFQSKRLFLQGMGKWSGAAIAAVLVGGCVAVVPSAPGASWINRGGGGWINRRGGGLIGGGGSWVNRAGGGGGWINRGGGGWINRRGGGSWINRR